MDVVKRIGNIQTNNMGTRGMEVRVVSLCCVHCVGVDCLALAVHVARTNEWWCPAPACCFTDRPTTDVKIIRARPVL
jgi:hypothetical protein